MKNTNRPAVLVTGSEGFIGDALVRRLGQRFAVASFDVKRPSKDPKAGDFIPCDLTNQDSLDRALDTLRRRSGGQLASVVHLAAYYDFSGAASPLYRELTYEGTQRLLEGLNEGLEVEQFLYVSTLLVMKPSDDEEPIDESSEVDPAWLYPEWKLATERLIERVKGPLKSVILRVSGVYNDECHSIPLAQQIARIYEKRFESYFFPGDPETGQAYVHLDDLTECIEKAIDRRHQLKDAEVFLVAEPDVMSYEELQEAIGELIHREGWPAVRVPKVLAKAGAWAMDHAGREAFIKPWMIDLTDQNYPVAIDKARQILEWEPRRRLRHTLPRMIGSLLSEPRYWYEQNGLEAPEEVNR